MRDRARGESKTGSRELTGRFGPTVHPAGSETGRHESGWVKRRRQELRREADGISHVLTAGGEQTPPRDRQTRKSKNGNHEIIHEEIMAEDFMVLSESNRPAAMMGSQGPFRKSGDRENGPDSGFAASRPPDPSIVLSVGDALANPPDDDFARVPPCSILSPECGIVRRLPAIQSARDRSPDDAFSPGTVG